ncbi:hypothetical protein [Streptomyces sp. YGL11-2]|uniref:hypothetical protein n=1 Tax=Streptomyces sp. YGL11-2 TaxID=3414028 RepID=UPI003CF529A1
MTHAPRLSAVPGAPLMAVTAPVVAAATVRTAPADEAQAPAGRKRTGPPVVAGSARLTAIHERGRRS